MLDAFARNDSVDVFKSVESEVRSYSRAFPTTFGVARNAEIWDREGNRYIDFLAGCGALSYGHNNPILKAALLEYIASDGISMGLDMQTEAKERFLVSLRDRILAPRGMDYRAMFTGPTGTNAVEAALKLARKATGRTNVLSFTNGFHGVTLGAVACTGNSYHRKGASMPLSGVMTVPYEGYMGDDFDTLGYIDRLLSDPSSGVDAPAATIVESIQGEGGLNAASAAWLSGLQELCNKHGILLILDDIQAGCGRSGDFFGFEHADISPDIITLSKSLSGYGMPFSLVLVKPEYDVFEPAEHNGTFRGNNLAFVTSMTMIEHYWADDAFAKELVTKCSLMDDRLRAIMTRYPEDVVELRGRGMMVGLRFADPEIAGSVARAAFTNGLIIERSGPHDEVVKCLAPLTAGYDVLDEGLDILDQSTGSVLGGDLPSGFAPCAKSCQNCQRVT